MISQISAKLSTNNIIVEYFMTYSLPFFIKKNLIKSQYAKFLFTLERMKSANAE